MIELSTGLKKFADQCRYNYREYVGRSRDLASFRKYIEFDVDCGRKDSEIPVFALKNVYAFTENSDSSKKYTFSIPVLDYNITTPTSTINMFFSQARWAADIYPVKLKDKTYKLGSGILFDSDDNLLFVAVTNHNNDYTSGTFQVEKFKVYVSIKLLQNVKNTVEKAIMQKIVPYLVEKYNAEVVILKNMPFEKNVVNSIDNDNFNTKCNEIIKKEILKR